MHKYHTVYRTTCLVTGKYYIGKHSTDDVNDSYLGSGLRLLNSVKKHGRDQHSKEILASFATDKEAYDFEKEAIKPHLGQELCMNLCSGGNGFGSAEDNPNYRRPENNPMYGRKHTAEALKKISKASKGRSRQCTPEEKERLRTMNIGRKHKPETIARMSQSQTGERNWAFGKKFSEQHRQKLSEAHKGNKHTAESLDKQRVSMQGKNSKLNEDSVREIKRLLKAGAMTGAAIARLFNVSQDAICKIKKGKNWGWVNEC